MKTLHSVSIIRSIPPFYQVYLAKTSFLAESSAPERIQKAAAGALSTPPADLLDCPGGFQAFRREEKNALPLRRRPGFCNHFGSLNGKLCPQGAGTPGQRSEAVSGGCGL